MEEGVFTVLGRMNLAWEVWVRAKVCVTRMCFFPSRGMEKMLEIGLLAGSLMRAGRYKQCFNSGWGDHAWMPQARNGCASV